MTERFEYTRYDVRMPECQCDDALGCECSLIASAASDGDWVRAEDAIARETETEGIVKRMSILLADVHFAAGGLETGESVAVSMNTLVERVRRLRAEAELHRSLESHRRAIRNGRGGIRGLWSTLTHEAAARVRALKDTL